MEKLGEALVSALLQVEPRIRTVHLIVREGDDFIVKDHWAKEEIQDFYGTEERVHDFLKLGPAVLIGASETIKDIVGSLQRITVTYDKVTVTYVPLNDANNIITVSFPTDAHESIPKLARRIHELTE
jgi:hypothetical protein